MQGSDNAFQLPPRPLAAAWPVQQAAAQQGAAQPAQLLPLSQAQQADEWLFGQPLTAHDTSCAEEEAAAAQLSPADMVCLMAEVAGPGSLPPPAQQPQCTEGSRGSHLTQLAPAGASPLPVQPLLQQPQRLGCDEEISPDMWDSLLGDSRGELLAEMHNAWHRAEWPIERRS